MKRWIAALTVLVSLLVVSSAFAWGGARWTPNTCGADLTTLAEGQGAWWVQVSDESGVLYETTVPAVQAHKFLTVGGFSRDTGFHTVTYKVANAANHADGLVTYSQEQLNCSSAGTPGPAGPAGPPGTGYDCTGTAVPTGGSPAMCPGPVGPAAKTCKSSRVYRVKIGDRFRGDRVNSARLTWDNGQRHAVAVRRKDGRLHAVVSFRGVTSPLRGLWAITMRINFDHGKQATLTRNVRLCAPSDGNLNFATDVHRDGS
jgi:hypothetical protein